MKSAEQSAALIQNLFSFSDSDELFAKLIVSFGGVGAIKISKELISKADSKKIKIILEINNNSCYIIQEKINQHPELSRLNPSSVNTIGIAKISTSNSEAEVILLF